MALDQHPRQHFSKVIDEKLLNIRAASMLAYFQDNAHLKMLRNVSRSGYVVKLNNNFLCLETFQPMT